MPRVGIATAGRGTGLDPGGDVASRGSLERAREIALLRGQGLSLDEVALRFGVSRERVRQILQAYGGPDAQVVAAARRRRAEQQAQARLEELLECWRAGEELRGAARALGLQPSACRRAIARGATELDRAARSASLAHLRAAAPTYSDRDIAIALTSTAAGLGRTPSAREYEALAHIHEGPSVKTILNRMGGWTTAVQAAGLTPVRSLHTRSRRWTVEACWAAVRAVAAELDEIPTVITYDRCAAGRPDLPSSATLRNRLGRWSAITTRLAAERHLTSTARAPAR
jgi:transcriptional regulator with XRE-family HTH domain